jgi:hypothetical protein
MPKRNTSPDPNGVIQFRPGESFGRAITDLARGWGQSRNEVIRRLALLAWSGLTMDYYDPLDRLAQAVGGPQDFLRACDYVRGVLTSLDRDRLEQKVQPLNGKDRLDFVHRCVRDIVTGRQGDPSPKRKKTTEEAPVNQGLEAWPEPVRDIDRTRGETTAAPAD